TDHFRRHHDAAPGWLPDLRADQEQPGVQVHAGHHALVKGRAVRQGAWPDRRLGAVPHQAVHARGTARRDPHTRQSRTLIVPRGVGHSMARILLIEDSPTDTAVLTQLLERNGHFVLASDNAEDGIEICRRERPDLVLMDIILPGMNGFQATRALSRDEDTRGIPVLIVSK